MRPRGTVRPSKPGDAESLAPRLREADLLELEGWGLIGDPVGALVMSEAGSDTCCTIEIEGEVVGMYGVGAMPTMKNIGVIWLLGSEDIRKIAAQFMRESKPRFAEMIKPYDMVCNKVHEENTLHLKWIKYLGFTFISHTPPFYEFARIV